MNRTIPSLLLVCVALHVTAQKLPVVPASAQPKAEVIKGVQPQDLALPAVVMAFGMLIAGNFLVSTAWNQNEMAMPVLVTCGVVGAASIPLSISSRKKAERRRLSAGN